MTEPDARAERARIYRRRRIVVFGALALVVALFTTGGFYTANALGAPIPAATPAVTDPEPIAAAPQQLSLPVARNIPENGRV